MPESGYFGENINKVAFRIFGIDIYWYSLCILLGIICGAIIAFHAAKKIRWKQENMENVILISVPAALVGARLYYVIFQWQDYANNWLEIFNVRNGGLAIYGGIIGGILAAYFYCRAKKLSIFELLDITAPSLALGQAIGRWGNFFNQEAYGPIISNPKLHWFPFAVYIPADQQYHYATFFYESVWCLIIVAILLFMRKRFKHKGDVILTYVMLYGFERMLVEGLRQDSLYIANIRVSQMLSAMLFVSIALFFIIRKVRERNQSVPITNKFNPNYVWADDTETEIENEIVAVEKAPKTLYDEKLDAEPNENMDIEVKDEE